MTRKTKKDGQLTAEQDAYVSGAVLELKEQRGVLLERTVVLRAERDAALCREKAKDARITELEGELAVLKKKPAK